MVKWFISLICELQKNVDEAVEDLRSKGIDAIGVVCHVSNPQQRKNLVDETIKVSCPVNDFVFLTSCSPCC